MPFAYRASTSTDPTPMISLTFVEANYEILESLLRDRRRQTRNKDLLTELEYFSEDYDEEREMEPRPERTSKVTLPLRTRSPRVRRQHERVVVFKEASNMEGSKTERNTEGNRPSEAEAKENERTAMQQMVIMVSTIYEAIKFYTPKGIGTLLSKYSSQGPTKEQRIASEAQQADKEDIISCVDVEEKIMVNDQYLKQTITIRRWLQTKTKLNLQELLKAHTDVFAWTTAHMTGVPRTIMNAGATYQRLIDKVFNYQVRRNMEVNDDEIAIKSDSEEEMLAVIKETLERLRVINLKLNPKKRSFRVEEGVFSGHLIINQGIKAYRSKVKAMSCLQPPKLVSKIQSLGKLAAINRFPLKGADKTLPFMRTLKNCTSGKMV
uniref:Reverse transcriptase domain-containing protein n=1 Tax=Tanacetum cinerariifolium TaxID=118510 RepID=A0A6L2JC74_TANCI|nr:reverse transcriptase domain-containing protein [Tanacetum cinerariifolium]